VSCFEQHARQIVNKHGEGLLLDIVLGIVGGWIFFFGGQGVNGLNLYTMFVAVLGAVVVLVIYHAAARRRLLLSNNTAAGR
jgi:uncharacterized membrane protein YeaQ/YmgE (transglycosylase-associated protein family)